MVKRIAPIRVISFFLLAACGALCQSDPPSTDLLLLPDAPSAQLRTRTKKFKTVVDEAPSLFTLGAVGVKARVIRETELGRRDISVTYKAVSTTEESNSFFNKYLYPSLFKQNQRYNPSTSGSFMGRATDAVSRIFITRNDSGKRRLNTPYFLGALTSVAVHTAYRPYWARSTSATFNNFGSTMGSGAGINLLREFGPGIRQMVKGQPKFISTVGERITNNQTPREVVSTPAR